MIKHKTISEEQFFLSLVSELNGQKETRMLALMIHQFAVSKLTTSASLIRDSNFSA